MTELDDRALNGALAAALANAQAAFPAIPRDKEVTVQTKAGGSYKFKYAPLDSILNAVRKPLSENGLALSQLLDDGELVTILMHRDGGRLSGSVGLPTVEGVQALGSAITYLRRYSIQAILGIAAEEDDDGNHASGNTATVTARRSGFVGTEANPVPEITEDGGLIGTAITEKAYDFNLRQVAPEPGDTGIVGPRWKLPFRVKNGSKSFIVVAEDDMAETLAPLRAEVIDQRVTVWGHWSDETIPAKGTKPQINYRILHLDRIKTDEFTLPAPTEALPPPLFTDDDLARLDDELAS